MDKPKVVAIGGGSGLATVLRGLKDFPVSLSGIVTMTDNGRSSGQLSRQLGTLPPGDVRKCLAALASDEQLLTKLFEYRFQKGFGLSGHSLGNLLLLALADITGDFERAIQASSKILSIKGQVIPSTLEHVNLIATLKNGQQALGEVETAIQGHRFGIGRVGILPENVAANPTAVSFIEQADLIVVGPGSFYTSVVPNLLISDIRAAFEGSSAMKIYICNASTERGETENYTVTDHITELQRYIGTAHFDAALVNNRIIAQSVKEGKLGSVRNISTDEPVINNVPIVAGDFISEVDPLYHDHKKLAKAIWRLFTNVSAHLVSETAPVTAS
ncbi:MAG TPA: gluconeogenesis factor YvcK family protein [Candidatus Saccharimonadales bacterium]|nr:gluconeogenesis factor YvcK family protein [Candidatus Saccharimonadales bacterium]